MFALVLVLVLGVATPGLGQQVSVTKQERPDQGFERIEIRFDTKDRSFTPLRIETRETKESLTVSRRESVVQIPRANGRFFDVEHTITVTEQLGGGRSRSVTDMVEADRQGKSRLTRQVTEEITETPDGKTIKRIESSRNSSGQMVMNGEVITTETKRPDGSMVRAVEERGFDVNHRPVLTRQVDEVVMSQGANQTVTESTIRSPEHISGQMRETARERTVMTESGNRTQTERVIQTPRGSIWTTTMRVVSTETTASNGEINRETIKYEPPDHAGAGQSVRPRLKIIETYAPDSGDQSSLDRKVYVRDVNNRWVPKTFSSKIPGRGTYKRRE